MAFIQRNKNPPLPIPEQGLYDFITSDFSKYGNRKALIDVLTDSFLTFNDVKRQTEAVAASLWHYGVRQGDVVTFFSNNGLEYAIALLACSRIGAVSALANTLYVEGELQHHLQDTGAQYIFTSQANIQKVIKVTIGNVNIKQIIVFGDEPGCIAFKTLLNPGHQYTVPPQPNLHAKRDIAIMPFSSGTTGLPKGVCLTHYNMVAAIQAIMNPGTKLLDLSRPDNVLIYQPFSHIYGTVLLTGLMRYGSTLVIFPAFDFELMLKTVQKYKSRTLFFVPPVAVVFSKSPIVDKYDLTSVETILSGAAPLSKESEDEVKARFKQKIAVIQGYGMTETGAAGIICPYDKTKDGSVGVVSPSMEGKVIHLETGKNLGVNQKGEVLLRGPNTMIRYLNNPKATIETVDRDGWLHTGDIGYFDEEGYFFIIDRKKELIKYKGYQVAPAELEALLLTHPSILDSGVIGIPDLEGGELPRAYVVKRPGATVSESDIQQFVMGKVAPYKHLRGGVMFVPEIPKSASGKILRKDMRKWIAKSKI